MGQKKSLVETYLLNYFNSELSPEYAVMISADWGAGKTYFIKNLIESDAERVNPSVYLVDVLQRMDSHPANAVHELTPRLWKEKFAANPMISDVD